MKSKKELHSVELHNKPNQETLTLPKSFPFGVDGRTMAKSSKLLIDSHKGNIYSSLPMTTPNTKPVQTFHDISTFAASKRKPQSNPRLQDESMISIVLVGQMVEPA